MDKNTYIVISAKHELGVRFGKTESLVVNSPQEAIEFFNKFSKDFIVVMELFMKRSDLPDILLDKHMVSDKSSIENVWNVFNEF